MDGSDIPSLALEEEWWRRGLTRVAGVDEVGRGAWAGPVAAAAVILPADHGICDALADVRDSKALPPSERERLALVIRDTAVAVSVGWAPACLVDSSGLLAATVAAMNAAVAGLGQPAHHAIVDGPPLRGLACRNSAVIRGDARCLSIAAASIVAKVARDAAMAELDSVFSGYRFAAHKGYGTDAHRAALARLGACAEHRLSYAPVAAIVAQSWC